RFLRGVYNQRPSLPRYTTTWDVSIVLHYIENTTAPSLKDRTTQLATYMALASGQRIQVL
ncbi:hypothetical protein CAPTEDRAFT_29823, partial [Capitella teleta]